MYLFIHHLRSFLLQMEIQRSTARHYADREMLNLWLQNEVPPSQSSPRSSVNPLEVQQKVCKIQSRWRQPRVQGPLKQLSKAPMNSKNEAANTGANTGLDQGLCILIIALSLVFLWNSRVCKQVSLWF